MLFTPSPRAKLFEHYWTTQIKEKPLQVEMPYGVSFKQITLLKLLIEFWRKVENSFSRFWGLPLFFIY